MYRGYTPRRPCGRLGFTGDLTADLKKALTVIMFFGHLSQLFDPA